MVTGQLLAVAHEEMPVQRIERAGLLTHAFRDLVGAVAAVVGHPFDVLTTGAIGLGAQVAAIGVHDHAQGVGQLDPVEGIHIHRQVPVADLARHDAGQQGEVAGDHQPLDMVGIGMLQSLADGLAHALHLGFAGPVELRQWPLVGKCIALGVLGHVQPVNASDIFAPADQLADEIAVIDHGKVIARGTSDALKKQVGGERLEITVENEDIPVAQEIVARVSGNTTHLDLRTISAPVLTGSVALMDTLRALDEAKIHPLDIGLKRPSLDDVFLSLTGHVAEEIVEEPIKKKRGGKK